MMVTITKQARLDLSRLTDEEAMHIWQVIQRDFNLRRKEEDRLGDLKSSILVEDTRRNLLTYQSNSSDSFCIHCLQPFKFLINRKCQCRNCKAFICKGCSRFNKNEHGWMCNPCCTAKFLKIAKLEWFYENMYARFNQSGTEKVMISLYKRFHGSQSCSQTELRAGLFFSHDYRRLKGSGRQHCKLVETAQEALSLVDLEELELKQKLKKLTENLSDKENSSDENFTSDEDVANQLTNGMKPSWKKQCCFPPALINMTSANGSFFANDRSSTQRGVQRGRKRGRLDRRKSEGDRSRKSVVDIVRPKISQRRWSYFEVSAASCELSRLEGEVAMAVAKVQSTQIEITDIENRIAALGQ